MDERLLRLDVVGGQALDVVAAQVEEAAARLARQVEARDRLREEVRRQRVGRDLVVEQVEFIRECGDVPAVLEVIVELELALGVDVAAQPLARRAVGTAGEGAGIGLVDAGEAEIVQAVVGPLTELAGAEEALVGEHGGRQREVVVRRQIEEDRLADPVAELRLVERLGLKEAGLLRHRRVGRGEVGHVGDGQSEELEVGVLVVDHLLVVLVDDPLRTDAPKRRLVGIVLARVAGGVGAPVEDGGVAPDPFHARRAVVGLLRRVGPQAVDEAVAEIVGQVEGVAVQDGAVLLRQLGVPHREQALGRLVVDDLVGLQGSSVVVDAGVADRRHGVGLVVLVEFVGLDEHLGVLVGLRLEAVGHRLRGDRPGDERRRRQAHDHQGTDGEPDDGPASDTGVALTLRGGWAPHQPSSWLSSARAPSMLATMAGDQAATGGLSTPEPPRSPTNFVAT